MYAAAVVPKNPFAKTRERKRFTVGDGITIEIEAPPPRLAFRTKTKLAGAFGPSLAGLLAGAGINAVNAKGEQVTLGWVELFASVEAATMVLNALVARLGEVNVDLVCDLIDDLVVGRCWISLPGAAEPIHVTHVDLLDEFLPDGFAMIAVARFALELAVRPTMPVSGGDHPTG